MKCVFITPADDSEYNEIEYNREFNKFLFIIIKRNQFLIERYFAAFTLKMKIQ